MDFLIRSNNDLVNETMIMSSLVTDFGKVMKIKSSQNLFGL